ncbi:MAG: hypothetical protein JJT78_16245 [Leptospira sp.]|nr:hypothetical protein [Leptospira sp.]
MKVLLDIQDKKAASLLEVLKGLSYVKTKPLTKANAEFLEDAKTAVDVSPLPSSKLASRRGFCGGRGFASGSKI